MNDIQQLKIYQKVRVYCTGQLPSFKSGGCRHVLPLPPDLHS